MYIIIHVINPFASFWVKSCGVRQSDKASWFSYTSNVNTKTFDSSGIWTYTFRNIGPLLYLKMLDLTFYSLHALRQYSNVNFLYFKSIDYLTVTDIHTKWLQNLSFN